MNKRISLPMALAAIFLAFFGLSLLNNMVLDRARVDLTQDGIYSVSDGTKDLLANLEEPVNLYYFFSEKTSEGMTPLRTYANRVQSLLEEYALYSDGKVKLHIIDPEPFSEAEDRAAEFGLTAANLGIAGESLYFGLGGTNALDDQEIIAFFDPQQEAFLEYEISKLIHKLSAATKVKLAVVTDLPVAGGPDPMRGGMQPAWTFYSQLEQLYDVELVDTSAKALPESTSVVMLVHPKGLSDELIYAIDQFVVTGGNLMAFVDPHSESAPAAGQMGFGGANGSHLEKLMNAWGLDFDAQNVVLDAQLGLEIRLRDGGVGRHLGYIGLGQEQVDMDDAATGSLELINGASFGALQKKEDAGIEFLPLLTSSQHSGVMAANEYAMTQDPQQLAKAFSDSGQSKVLAARVIGEVSSAFDTAPEGKSDTHIASGQANIAVVADTDVLADRFWVQRANFFGQVIATPFANNGDLVSNLVESLSGGSALMGIRARGRFSRPFARVDELTVEAEQRFREQEQLLQARLEETESKLTEIQAGSADGGLVLTPEQEATLASFMDEKLEIRKALREVRHQLDKDIERLGSWLKFINIGLMPLLLTLALIFVARRSVKREK